MELAQQIKADFEEAFQGPNAKVIFLCTVIVNHAQIFIENSGTDYLSDAGSL